MSMWKKKNLLWIIALFSILLSLNTFAQEITLATNVTHCYTFDNADITTGQNQDDKAGTNDLVATGTPTTGATGKIGEAYDFEEDSNQWMSTTDNFEDTGLFNFSVQWWQKLESTPNADGDDSFSIGTFSGDTTIGFFTLNTLSQLIVFSGALVTGETAQTVNFEHWVVTYDGTNAYAFKDGAATSTPSIAKTLNIVTNKLYVGRGAETNAAKDFDGIIDEFATWKRNLTVAEVAELYNSNSGLSCANIIESAAPAFTVTVKDLYDETLIENFSITIFNETDTFTNTSSTGSISYNNITNGLYNINITSNFTGGYFNRTFFDVDVTSDFQADIFQSVLVLKALDALDNSTINVFNAVTNKSDDSTTNGQILILIKNGTFQLNVTSSGFDMLVTNFTIGSLNNVSLNVSMGSVFSFFLVRETTNNAFNANLTNSTEINVFCPNQTITINMSSSPNVTRIINCQFTLMQLVISYGGIGSYFRTLIPPFSQKNITFYTIDLLQGDIAIQRVVKLFDITGEFANAKLTVKRAVGGIIRTIIDQRFDIASETNLFLIKDALYTLSIDNGVEVIILGNLIPTEAGTQTITLPKIEFTPQELVLGGNVSWTYTFNASQGILRVQYVDVTNRTTLVRFTVFNGSDNKVFQGESDNNSTVTMTFNQIVGNTSYRSELFFIHPGLSNHTDKKVFYGFLDGGAGALDLVGWSIPEQKNIKKWFAFIFLFFLGLLFSRAHAGLAMTSVIIFLWLFKQWEWIIISDLIFGFVALIAVVAWIVEAMKKN